MRLARLLDTARTARTVELIGEDNHTNLRSATNCGNMQFNKHTKLHEHATNLLEVPC